MLTPEQPTITQADRDAAANEILCRGLPRTLANLVREGGKDGHHTVQAFARHRIATEQDCARQRDLWTATAYSCGYDAAVEQIVAWLRDQWECGGLVCGDELADAIEAGEHHK